MSDQFPNKPESSDLKEWLAQLEKSSPEEDARKYLAGDKPQDQDIILEETADRARSELVDSQRSDLFERIFTWLGRRNILPSLKRNSFENEPVILEDEQVSKRLIGGDTSEVPVEKSILNFAGRKQRRPRSIKKTAPELQVEASPIPSQAEPIEIVEPDLEQLRATAIEGYEPELSDNLGKPHLLYARLREWFRYLTLFQKMAILMGTLLVLGLGIYAVVLVSTRSFHSSESPMVGNLNSTTPIPSSVLLPDGQIFSLKVGTVTDGSWTPKGAEWLAGTEVPRWLALPWSNSLESTALSYKVNAPISLHMSNGDTLVYRFESALEIPRGGMGAFHANTTDLLIILSKPGASTRLVLVAGP
jgi:hypothetical protein